MPVPNSFANVTTSIPLSQLDANFNTPITLGNTAIQLGNTVTTLNNMTLANVTVSSGNVTITNVSVTTANVTTANIATAQIANVTVSGTGTFAAGSNTAPSITTSGDTNTGIFFPAADTVAIGTGGTEALRVNSSQNVGIGTQSPSARLHSVASNEPARFAATTTSLFTGYYHSTSTLVGYVGNGDGVVSAGGTNNLGIRAENSLIFASGGNNLSMTLNSSGNLGLGVTPSAWQANNRAVQLLEGWASLSANNSQGCCDLANNGYNAGSSANNLWKYTNGSQPATLYQQSAGQHRWFYAASGTANATITFTQAMTLDASGNLGVGATTVNAKLEVKDGHTRIYHANGANTAGYGIEFSTDGGGLDTTIASITPSQDGASVRKGILVFSTSNAGAPAERARITSGGDFLVGKAAADDSSPGVWLYNNSAQAGRINIAKNTSGLFNAIANYHSGTYVGGVNYSNTATSFPTSSDVRLKKNIVDAGSASAKIEQIRIVSHGWKHDDEIVEFGVVAQELVNVAPQAVSAGDDREEIETTWGVDYSKLVPMLIKAHQEQQVMIYEMKAEIAALKGTA